MTHVANPTTTASIPRSSIPLRDDVGAMAFVQANPLFENLAAEHLNTLLDAGCIESYAPGDVVEREGESTAALCVVFDGYLALLKSTLSDQVEVARITRPTFLGMRSALTGEAMEVSAVALSDVQLVRFPAATVRRIADADHRFGRVLATLMSGWGHEVARKLGEQ